MDRSTSSLPIGRKTRDSSPISERGRIIADLESQTSALGHVGLLKWQRNDLRKELLQQKGLAEFERQNAANARKLALRLAAQIAVKEARLKSHAEALSKAHGNAYLVERNSDAVVKDLESKLQEDLTLANSLLRTFGGSDGISSTCKLILAASSII
jgi:phosphopantetheinyl transferase (holo-ACP synthase)